MGALWAALKSAGKQWAGASGSLRKSDTAILNMTGFDPRHLDPQVYRTISLAIKDQFQYYFQIDEPLNDEEVTLLKLSYLYEAAQAAEDSTNAAAFDRAIHRLRTIAADRIRPAVSLSV